jgi:hypothetical protein
MANTRPAPIARAIHTEVPLLNPLIPMSPFVPRFEEAQKFCHKTELISPVTY